MAATVMLRRSGDTIVPEVSFLDFDSPHQRYLVGKK
jgi:hypothetical protein